jgi:uncharacterized SAM-binding protein YcdF (DUF218 family)
MNEFFKEAVRPSSVVCLLTLTAPGVALLYVPKRARWGRRWLSVVLAVYWILSAPISVRLLTQTLAAGYTPVDAAQVRDAQAVVLLSAGSLNLQSDGQTYPLAAVGSAWRTLEAARVYHLAGSPLVIAAGGASGRDGTMPESEALRLSLIALAVPPERIISETTSRNTREEAAAVSDILRARGLTRVVLVTSPLHMRRSMAVFARAGVRPVPAIAPLTTERRALGYSLVPSLAGLFQSDAVVYEWAALGYYWSRGWMP